MGCSTGGHQGIAEAHRYPDDYDGIVAGAPAYDSVRMAVFAAWNWRTTHEDPESTIPAAKIPAIRQSVVEACDGADGIKDGVIEDPRRCPFDPMALVCAAGDGANCLTRKQAIALKEIYQGPVNPRTGKLLSAGLPPGSEANTMGLDMYAAQQAPFKGFREWVPGLKGSGFDFDRDVETVRKGLSFTDYSDPHLDGFRKRGGKLLVYSGWADPIATAGDIIGYYEGLQRAMGGPAETAKFARLFMLPGMGHCRGGDGPNSFDALAALVPWVEKGIAPDQFTASLVARGQTVRTRPICAYPQYAKWNGTGSTDDAANFTCVNR
jgi:feruloyl esterase